MYGALISKREFVKLRLRITTDLSNVSKGKITLLVDVARACCSSCGGIDRIIQ
jgi:hypothetical protein